MPNYRRVFLASAPTNEATIPVLLSVAPLGRVPMTKEHDYQYQMLQVRPLPDRRGYRERAGAEMED